MSRARRLVIILYIFDIRNTCLVHSLFEHYVWAAIYTYTYIEHLFYSVIIEESPLSVVIAYSISLGCGGNEMHMFWHSRTDSPLSVSCTYVIASGFTLAKKVKQSFHGNYCELSWLVIGGSLTGLRWVDIYITIFFAFTLGRKLSMGTSLSHIWMNCVSFLFASLLRSLIDCYHVKKNQQQPTYAHSINFANIYTK